MFLPYSYDILYDRRPWMAYFLIPIAVILSIGYVESFDTYMMEWGDTFDGVPTQPILPIDGLIPITPIIVLIYLVISAFYLWVFGIAICSKIGNILFTIFLIGLSLSLHILWGNRNVHDFLPMSCLIEWLLGMCLFYWPTNSVDCFILIPMKTSFSLSTWWMVLIWFGFDLFLVVVYELATSLIVLPLCLVGGIVCAGVLQRIGIAVMDPEDRTLWQILQRQPEVDHTVEDLWAVRKQNENQHRTEPDLPLPAYSPPEKESSQERDILCQCGRWITLPQSTDEKTVRCPHCSRPLRFV